MRETPDCIEDVIKIHKGPKYYGQNPSFKGTGEIVRGKMDDKGVKLSGESGEREKEEYIVPAPSVDSATREEGD